MLHAICLTHQQLNEIFLVFARGMITPVVEKASYAERAKSWLILYYLP